MTTQGLGRFGILAFCLALASGRSEAAFISANFDGLANKTVVTNQYAGVTFSSTSGEQVRVANLAGSFGTSGPNFIGTASTSGALDFTHDVVLTFSSLAKGLSFNAAAVDSVGKAATVEVFYLSNGVASEANVAILGKGTPLIPVLVDLGAYTDVSKIVITSVTDKLGLGYDDFQFTNNSPSITPSAVPEPSSLILTGSALAAGLAIRWRRGGSRKSS